MIYCCSDLHLGHDKSFIYEPRGAKSVKESAVIICERFRKTLTSEDDLYILGDILVGPDSDEYLPWLAKIPGKLHLLWGNHDTDRRKELLSNLEISLPSTRICPLVGLSKPPNKFNNVDLPAPLGPRITINLLSSILRLTLSNAFCSWSPTLYIRLTFLNSIKLMLINSLSILKSGRFIKQVT